MIKPGHETKSELAVQSPKGKKHLAAKILLWLLFLMLLIVSSIQNVVASFRYFTSSYNDNVDILQHDNEEEDAESESCLRPRSNSDAVAKSPLQPPFINLGMPKMGSSSLHKYFQCGGYKSVHWRCEGKKFCGDCIESAIKAGRSPLSISQCTTKKIDSYAQIDKGPENLVQVNYLNEIVGGVPNATFILTFRDMANWYKSMTHWHPPNNPESNLRRRFENANITGLPKGVGRNVSEFSAFYCEYVKRVRKEVAKYPGHSLIEIDIEDPTAGWKMEEAFGTNHTCWGKQNVAQHNEKVSEEELQRRH